MNRKYMYIHMYMYIDIYMRYKINFKILFCKENNISTTKNNFEDKNDLKNRNNCNRNKHAFIGIF